MLYSIDYYSYTIPTEKPFTEGMFYDQQDTVIRTFATALPDIASEQQFVPNWTHEGANRFYQHRLRHDESGVALSYGKTNAHVFVEFSGKTCGFLTAAGLLADIIRATAPRCSRIDFACDIECETSPKEFIEQRGNKSFKSSGNKYSPTGGTEYIGGRTSERMARVYRYYSPHPRSHLLRVEAEYKGDAAKAAAKRFTTHGLLQSCLDAHQPFKWLHNGWLPDIAEQTPITYRNYSPTDANTVRWLYGDVITALRKAVKNDIIDLHEWISVLVKNLKTED